MNQEEQSNTDDLFNEGNKFFDQKIYQCAISFYIKVMQTNQQRYQEFCKRGIYFAELGKDISAIRNFIKQYHYITLSYLAWYLRAMASDNINKTQVAISDFTQIIKRCPQFKFCYLDRGNAYRSLQKLEQAVLDYSKAIKLDKQYAVAAVAYYNRGLTLSELGRKEEAILDLTMAISINLKILIIILVEIQRKLLKQIRSFQKHITLKVTKAIELNPQYDSAFSLRGIVLLDLARKEEAIKDCTKAIELNPQFAQAYNTRGCGLNQLGRKEEANKDFTKAIEINPQYVSAYFNRGVVLSTLGRQAESIQDFTKAIQIDPQYAAHYYHRGLYWMIWEKKKKRIRIIQRLILLNNKNHETIYNYDYKYICYQLIYNLTM